MVVRTTRFERITNLVLALLDTSRPMSLREIGGAVAGYPSEPGALRQAFERDKRTLREGGIPIAVERIDGEEQVGYRILPEDYYLPDLGLDPDEEAALAFAVAAVRIDGGVGRDALAKLGSAGVDPLPPVAILPSLPALGPLQEAMRRRAVVTFAYHGRRREVEPYGLAFRSGAWYLVGKDRGAGAGGAMRTFRVDRLEDAPRVGERGSYDPPEGFEVGAEIRLAPWVSATGEPSGTASRGGAAELGPDGAPGRPTSTGAGAVEVLVDVDVREARGALALAGESSLERRAPDGSVRMRFRVADEGAFVAWVLGCGDAVEVLEPAAMRDAVVRALEAASR
ncbi:MAG: WYL domain-containing protein [Actinomycetota bacterium]|nr:WYL domain-containing protein [Actinomycetota bacterium]